MVASHAAAEPAVGPIQGTKLLAYFDTTAPGAFTDVKQVTGLGDAELLEDVDYRWHPNGALDPLPPSQLFALAVQPGLEYKARLYSIDLSTAVATPAGPAFDSSPGGSAYGIDFNPSADRVRAVNEFEANFRVNPDNGALAGKDTNLNPAGKKVTGVAYDRVDTLIPPVVPASTTAYAIGTGSNTLYTLGGVDQTPSPNFGELLNPKPLGVFFGPGTPVGFDISPSGTAYASLIVGGEAGLYTVNLATGAATLLGKTPEPLSGLAIVPAVSPPPPPPLPTPAAVPDRTAPTVKLDGIKGSLSLRAFLKGIAIEVQANEPASVDAELLAAARSAKLASFNLVLASGSLGLGAGERTLTLRPSKRLVGSPTKAFKVSLRVTATDAGGNSGTSTNTIKIKPAAKKPKR